jgi:hypothetical protein
MVCDQSKREAKREISPLATRRFFEGETAMSIFIELLRNKKPGLSQAKEAVERPTEQAEHAPVWLEQCRQEALLSGSYAR